METLENPVIKDESIELRDQLRSEAEKAGPLAGNEFEAEPSAIQTEPRAPVETETAQEIVSNPDTKPEPQKPKAERPRDELGRFTKTEAGEDIPESERKPAEPTKPDETKPESDYVKAQKKKEREESVLKNFQKEKEEFRAETERIRQQLQREAAELQRAREQRTAPNATAGNRPRYSSAELWEAANDFDSRAEKAFTDGDPEAFKESLRLSREARQQAGQVYQLEQQAAQQAQTRQFQSVYAQVIDQAMKAEPELAKPDSELSKSVQTLLEQEPVFSHIPDGFAKAAQVAKWKIGYEKSTGLISGLEEENKKLKAENARLNGNLSLNRSGPSGGPTPPKRFEDMSMDEMRRELRGAAEHAGSLSTA
jgi:hypothetical protein